MNGIHFEMNVYSRVDTYYYWRSVPAFSYLSNYSGKTRFGTVRISSIFQGGCWDISDAGRVCQYVRVATIDIGRGNRL